MVGYVGWPRSYPAAQNVETPWQEKEAEIEERKKEAQFAQPLEAW